MYIIDLSRGFSFSLILKSLLTIDKHLLKQMISRTMAIIKPYTDENILKELKKTMGLDSWLQKTHEILKQHQLIGIKQAIKAFKTFDHEFQKLTGMDKIEILDFWEFFMYIAITNFFYLVEDVTIKATTPCVGVSSSPEVFLILKQEEQIIDTRAKEVSPLLALTVMRYFYPYLKRYSLLVEQVDRVIDPLDPGRYLNLFRGKACRDVYQEDQLVVLQTNIDDITPELITGVMHNILDMGALDYIIAPVIMKKGRSGYFLQVLCEPEKYAAVEEYLFRNTSTFGIRRYFMARNKLKRKIIKLNTSMGSLRVKQGYIRDQCIKVKPEFDDIITLSKSTGLPIIKVYNKVLQEIEKKF